MAVVAAGSGVKEAAGATVDTGRTRAGVESRASAAGACEEVVGDEVPWLFAAAFRSARTTASASSNKASNLAAHLSFGDSACGAVVKGVAVAARPVAGMDETDADVATGRARERGGEVALVGEASAAVSFAFTSAMYAVHSLWQLLGSAMVNSRIVFISGVSCSMKEEVSGGNLWIFGGNFGRVVYGSDTRCEDPSSSTQGFAGITVELEEKLKKRWGLEEEDEQ